MDKKIIVFSGTTEGRSFSEALSRAGVDHVALVATEYGELVMDHNAHVDIRMGRLDVGEMIDLFREFGEGLKVFDATHPFARIVTENIKEACEKEGAEYIRIKREISSAVNQSEENIRYFPDGKECAEALKETEGNILLTTGSKELSVFTEDPDVRKRIFARVLPSEESIRLAKDAGLEGKQVIAMQGPFSALMNEAMMDQYDIDILVTKETGTTGGFPEKMEACLNRGATAFVIGKPEEDEGISLEEAIYMVTGKPSKSFMKVSLVGIGPGGRSMLTETAKEVIHSANLVFGAERMIRDYAHKRTYPYYLSKDVLPVILEERPERVAILFSGDSGFFSGAKKMKEGLENGFKEAGLILGEDFSIDIIPGISSLSYFASKLGRDYSDGMLTSIHGKSNPTTELMKLLRNLKEQGKVFTLLSGFEDIPMIKGMIKEYGPKDARLFIGKDLTYPNEEIFEIDPFSEGDDLDGANDGSFVAYIETKASPGRKVFSLMNDDSFIRGKVPMTKEAIRHLSIARLELTDDAVLYDIGAGTGSIAVQAAALADTIKVYAIEMKDEGIELIRENVKNNRLGNVSVVKGIAPQVLGELEKPTHAFIGGSSGNLKDILSCLMEKNPSMRVVMNAVSLETISEITSVIKEFPVRDLTIEQIQASRSKTLGNYHMMSADNPVMICSFNFGKEDE